MVLNPEEGKVFGKISEIYDKTRVDYPKKAIDDILQYSKLKSESNVLDVGCGTGQLIMPLANRGLQVLGLDISKEMIDVARRKSSHLKNAIISLNHLRQQNFLMVNMIWWYQAWPGIG